MDRIKHIVDVFFPEKTMIRNALRFILYKTRKYFKVEQIHVLPFGKRKSQYEPKLNIKILIWKQLGGINSLTRLIDFLQNFSMELELELISPNNIDGQNLIPQVFKPYSDIKKTAIGNRLIHYKSIASSEMENIKFVICIINDCYVDNHSDQFRKIIHNSIGSELTIDAIRELFVKNKRVGMVSPKSVISDENNIDLFRNVYIKLCDKLNLKYLKFNKILNKLPDDSFWISQELFHQIYEYIGPIFTDQSLFKSLKVRYFDVFRIFVTDYCIRQKVKIIFTSVEIPYNSVNCFSEVRNYLLPSIENLKNTIANYTAYRRRTCKIVLYTAIIGNYDNIKLPEVLDAGIQYVCFSDAEIEGHGVFEIWPIDFFDPDPTIMARYIKTHPHKYFPDHEFAIWIDSNIIMRGDINNYIKELRDSGHAIKAIAHPLRNCIYEEAQACIDLKKEKPEMITRQIEYYHKEGYPANNGLIETNLLIMKHNDPTMKKVLNDWWSMINRYSKRDQLSFNYVLHKHKVSWDNMFQERYSCRDHPDFAMCTHGTNNGYNLDALKLHLEEARGCKPMQLLPHVSFPTQQIETIPVDIVICVHNALDDFRKCFFSINENTQKFHRVIIVNDGSDAETTKFINQLRNEFPEKMIDIIQNNVPLGYTKAANIGLLQSNNDFIILLNSDTIVTSTWVEKITKVAFSNPTTGIVGPLSNAASYQSIPGIVGQGSQTAINEIPMHLSIEKVNQLCEQWSDGLSFPSVGIIHGFCLGIKREVIDSIGYFDEVLFPLGYGEENDYCLRAGDAGFDLKVAINTFIFHAKSKSYSDDKRIILMQSGREALFNKHTEHRVKLEVRRLKSHPTLEKIRMQAESAFFSHTD